MIKTRTPKQKPVSVALRLSLPDASSAFIAGSFNDWSPTATPMVRTPSGEWCATLRLLPGRYEYRLVTDGAWRDVPDAPETVDNPHGSRNALLTV